MEVPAVFLVFLPEQSTTAPHVSPERISERIVEQIGAGGDFPSRRAGLRVVFPRQGSAAAGAEQIAGITSIGGPRGFLPEQFSTASPGPVHVDEHLPDSAEWVLFRATAPGINVVWVGERPEGGRSLVLAQGYPCQYIRPPSSAS